MAVGIETFDKLDLSTVGPQQTHIDVSGDPRVVGRMFENNAGAPGGSHDTISFDCGSPDMWARGRLGLATFSSFAACGLWVRSPNSSTETGFVVAIYNDGSFDNFELAGYTAGAVDGGVYLSLDALGAAGAIFTAGDIIEIRVIGDTLYGYYNSRLINTVSAAAHPTGQFPGCDSYGSAAADDFRWDWIQFGANGESFNDPYVVGERGAFASTGTTSIAVDLPLAQQIKVGNFLVAAISGDNSGTSGAASVLTASDARNGAWTIVGPANNDPGAANAGQSAWIAYRLVTTPMVNGDDVTFATDVAPLRCAIEIYEVANIDNINPVAVAGTTATHSGTTPSISRTPTAVGQMFFGVLGGECGTADTYTEDTDTTGGIWNTQFRTGSGTTTGGSTVVSAYKVVTSTAAQTWNPTPGTSRDFAIVAIVFQKKPFVAAPPLMVTREARANASFR